LSVLAQKRLDDRLKKRVFAGLAAAVLGIAAFTLAACGRAGAPELPPGPALSAAEPAPVLPAGPGAPPGSTDDVRQKQLDAARKNGFDQNGNPYAASGEKKSFILDFLLQ
jgi:hypothetical protein